MPLRVSYIPCLIKVPAKHKLGNEIHFVCVCTKKGGGTQALFMYGL